MFEGKSMSDVIKLASAGAGFTYDGDGRSLTDLVRLAEAASKGNASIKLLGVEGRSMSDLLKIAEAGRGNVEFV